MQGNYKVQKRQFRQMDININDINLIKRKIGILQSRLYYIKNKKEHNKKRKTYKRQSWKDRKDNPKNKK